MSTKIHSLIPNLATRCLVSRLATRRMDDIIIVLFAQISPPTAVPLHLFRFDKLPLLGRMMSRSLLVNSSGFVLGVYSQQ